MGNSSSALQLRRSQYIPGSRVVVSGGTSGIGLEIAKRYARRGCPLVLAARNRSRLQTAADECREQGSPSVGEVAADVSVEEECREIVARAVEQMGGIDILVLCAGVGSHFRFEETEDLSVYETLMRTNYLGSVYLTKFAWEYLKSSNGQIVVLSSMSGEVGLPERTAYCGSKFALTGFFEALRCETTAVHITLCCPPSVKTPMREHSILPRCDNGPRQLVPQQSGVDRRMPLETCVDYVILAADRRARKLLFPLGSYCAAYLRPFFPDVIDHFLKKAVSKM